MVQAEKKVLYLITKATWGGAQRYVFDLATRLPKGFTAVVAYGQAGKLAADLSANRIRTVRLHLLQRDVSVLHDFSSFLELLRTLRREKPDVLHLNSSKAAGLGALAGRVAGIPKIVFTAHGWPFKENRGFLSRWAMYLASWFTALFSHSVIVVSKEDEILGKDMWFVRRKIKYIPLGIDPIHFLSHHEVMAALSIPLVSPCVLTIAELTKNKGIEFAIDAIALLKQRGEKVSYYIIGEGEEHTRLQERAATKDVSDRVHFMGFLSNAAHYLKGFDLFLLPSIKEGMPYVLLEAAQAGIPIITTNIVDSAFMDIATSIQSIPAGDAKSIADSIQEIVRVPQHRTIADKHSLDTMIHATSACY